MAGAAAPGDKYKPVEVGEALMDLTIGTKAGGGRLVKGRTVMIGDLPGFKVSKGRWVWDSEIRLSQEVQVFAFDRQRTRNVRVLRWPMVFCRSSQSRSTKYEIVRLPALVSDCCTSTRLHFLFPPACRVDLVFCFDCLTFIVVLQMLSALAWPGASQHSQHC